MSWGMERGYCNYTGRHVMKLACRAVLPAGFQVGLWGWPITEVELISTTISWKYKLDNVRPGLWVQWASLC